MNGLTDAQRNTKSLASLPLDELVLVTQALEHLNSVKYPAEGSSVFIYSEWLDEEIETWYNGEAGCWLMTFPKVNL